MRKRTDIDGTNLNSSSIADEVIARSDIKENKNMWKELLQLSWKAYFCYTCHRYDEEQISMYFNNILKKNALNIDKQKLFHYCMKYADELVARMDLLHEMSETKIRDLMDAAGMKEFSEEEYRLYHSWSRIYREAEFNRLYGE